MQTEKNENAKQKDTVRPLAHQTARVLTDLEIAQVSGGDLGGTGSNVWNSGLMDRDQVR